jgi:Tol biopolymer transport system component
MGFNRLAPDGKHAAFHRAEDGAMNVWTISFTDGQPRQLTFEHTMAGWPAWSRDGKLLAIEVRNGPDTNIAVIPADGGSLVPVTHNRGQNWPYSWSPDDDQIAFAGYRNGLWNVFSVSRTTGAERRLTNYTRPNTFVRYPEWSPGGDRIVYEYGESTGNIWMLESR